MNTDDALLRLLAMVADKGGDTWDLSQTDREAIKAVLDDRTAKNREVVRLKTFMGSIVEGMAEALDWRAKQ